MQTGNEAWLRAVLATMAGVADEHELTEEEIAALLRVLDFVEHVDNAHPGPATG